MSFNPFNEKPISIDKTFEDWTKLYPKAYDKENTDPYTKTRIILMNGTEYEAVWYGHEFSRHCGNNDIRRAIAVIRRNEQQQQKKLSSLKPINESILETTISYEQLAVDLTVSLAKNEKDKFVKESLDFVLLEDFDHLYRFANLLEMDEGISAKRLVGGYTEITPGRPTIAEHRFATDDIKCHVNNKKACPITKLNASIITAAEQQTMNYYMNIGQFYKNDLGRKLYSEIAMIEEQHVTEYGSLMDTNCTWLEGLLEHEYTECYLYYSCLMDETDTKIKKIWDRCLTQEIAHLHQAKKLLQEYEGKDYLEIIPDPEFPTLLTIGSNKEYIRQVLKNTVCNTGDMECHTKVDKLPASAPFFKYQNIVNKNVNNVASHIVINEYLTQNREDYRYEDKPNPVKELQNRQMDNTSIAR